MYKIPPKYQKSRKNIPYLGPNNLFFCYDCNLPIINIRKCPSCNKDIRLLPLTPPYDVRPAMGDEIKEIQNLIASNFGENAKIIEEEDLILLNHLGSEDQMDEIIKSGLSIGTRRYDIRTDKWIIKLNENGLLLLEGKISKNWVKVDSGAKEKIRQGANILIPGVLDADSEIKKGNYIAIIDEENKLVAGGIARVNDTERKEKTRGVYAKNYLGVKQKYKQSAIKRSWNEVIELNLKELEKIENEAVDFIKKAKDELKLPVIVSFSGGKDSLVTLALVKKALPEKSYKVLFVNTGIEFKETVDYVRECSKELDFEDILITEEVPTELFWEAFEKYGPPGRDFRHCCKFAKLAPIKKAIERSFGDEKCISFVGQRRYESYRRATSDVWENRYVTNQINMSPIQNWTAFMIWLYIYWRKLPYNVLYETGYERIGCWACPSSDLAQFRILETNHPDLYNQLFLAVEKWRKSRNLPSNYWKYGLWRFKTIPTKIANVLSLDVENYNLEAKDTGFSHMQIGGSDCVTQPVTIIGSFSGGVSLDRLSSILSILGRVQHNKKLNFIRISNKMHSILVYGDGTFKINFKSLESVSKESIISVSSSFIYTVLRALECIKCGLCIGECKENAISFDENSIVVDDLLCSRCNRCSHVCPIVTIVYRDLRKDVKTIINTSEIEFEKSLS